MSRPVVTGLVVLLMQVLGQQTAWSDDWLHENVDRVVAIADIHGDYSAMRATLRQARIVNAEDGWVGGTNHLVVVGDILDRGPESRAAMDFLMRLEGEARDAGGRVHVLIGNHESMVLTGDMRYVSAAEYAAFAAEEDNSERTRWFELFVAQQGGDAGASRRRFELEYPPGYFAMRRAFRPQGRYGAWLLQKNVVEVINGTAFVHGGLAPAIGQLGLRDVNTRLQGELVEYVNALGILTDAEILLPTDSHRTYADILNAASAGKGENPVVLAAIETAKRLADTLLLNSEGPLWYRNNVVCPGIVEEHRINKTLSAIGVKRVVVGHTPTPNYKVLQRFNGRVIEIDTGMLGAYYGGSGNALILEGKNLSVVNQSGAAAVAPAIHPRMVGKRASDLSAQHLENLLRDGEIISREAISKNESLVSVSDGRHTVAALFSRRRSRGFYPGVAAYRLDTLLQLDMVPVTAKRIVDGKRGSLQFLPRKRTDEVARTETGSGGNALCSIQDQWAAMYVFDVLIHNEGRTNSRILYDPSTWQLILSGHRKSFARKVKRPPHLQGATLSISDGWEHALTLLTDAKIVDSLGDVLDRRRLAALMARRDKLLAAHEHLPGN